MLNLVCRIRISIFKLLTKLQWSQSQSIAVRACKSNNATYGEVHVTDETNSDLQGHLN